MLTERYTCNCYFEFNLIKFRKMKKIILTVFMVSIGLSSLAQSYSGKGDSKLNTGYQIYGKNTAIKASYDYGLNNLFAIGAGASLYLNDDVEDYFLFARTSFHLGDPLDLPNALDIYPGIDLGYLSSGNIGINGYLGVRYFFTKRFGLFAEIGSSGTVGISICL